MPMALKCARAAAIFAFSPVRRIHESAMDRIQGRLGHSPTKDDVRALLETFTADYAALGVELVIHDMTHHGAIST